MTEVFDRLGLALDEQMFIASLLEKGFVLIDEKGETQLRASVQTLVAYLAGLVPEGDQVIYKIDKKGPVTADNLAVGSYSDHEQTRGPNVRNKKGFVGVIVNQSGNYQANSGGHHSHSLGTFTELEDAIDVRDTWVCLNTRHGYLNRPEKHRECSDGKCVVNATPEQYKASSGWMHASPANGRFLSQGMIGGERIVPGYFDTAKEAHDAFVQELRKHYSDLDVMRRHTNRECNCGGILPEGEAPKPRQRDTKKLHNDPVLADRVLRLRRDGMSTDGIVRETGISRTAVLSFLKEHGLDGDRRTTKAGFKGVYEQANLPGTYYYQFMRNGERYNAGGFTSPEDASKAREARLAELQS